MTRRSSQKKPAKGSKEPTKPRDSKKPTKPKGLKKPTRPKGLKKPTRQWAAFEQASQRMDALKARIITAKQPDGKGRAVDDGSLATGYRLAARVGTEMVAAIVVGTGLGATIDYWLDSKPLFLIILFFLGAAAGICNIWKWSMKSLAPSVLDTDTLDASGKKTIGKKAIGKSAIHANKGRSALNQDRSDQDRSALNQDRSDKGRSELKDDRRG